MHSHTVDADSWSAHIAALSWDIRTYDDSKEVLQEQ